MVDVWYKNKKLSELAKIMDIYPQVLKNVTVSKEGKWGYINQKGEGVIPFV